MTTTIKATERWLESLGYEGTLGVVHRRGKPIAPNHPYAREIDLMLNTTGEIGSSAVYEVDQVPAVCFIEQTSSEPFSQASIDEIRGKIWNQNLVSIVLVVTGETATAYAAPRKIKDQVQLQLSAATETGPFSAADVATGNIYGRLPEWFNKKNCVDRVLLDNLGLAEPRLQAQGLKEAEAQLLLGKCIFVSYLQDREIVGERYREKNRVKNLAELLDARDAKGLDRLFRRLKKDFNGNLLELEGGANIDWRKLSPGAFDVLGQFLARTLLRSGQQSFWPYDFRYIPVELISGIYETFLGAKEVGMGAVYTPRHLASLAVDEVFRGIKEPWKEIVLDGACGSGILLTTSYRRMLGAAQAARKRRLTYQQRQAILLNGIRGGDISDAACRVTAFSLYLALLEDLAPSDIVALQDDHEVKLPELIDQIISSEDEGDFFNDANPVAKKASVTIVISNPPWREAKSKDGLHRYEQWWQSRFGAVLPYRQIALAFARRATDALKPGGRLCLLLPVSTLGAKSI